MTREEAQEYAKTMSYKEAVLNCIYAKGIAYRKASLIKLRELAEIADKLERNNDMTREEAIKYLIKPVATSTEIGEEKQKEFEAYNMAIDALSVRPIEGEWVNEWKDIDGGRAYGACCSLCHTIGHWGYNFCPRCGAKMVQGGEDE